MSKQSDWKRDIETFARMREWLSVMIGEASRRHAIKRMQEIKDRWPQHIKDAIPEN